MAIYGRNRDFSLSTLNIIRENLSGETVDYKEFSRFIEEHGSAFETINLSSALLPLDSYMTNARIFMSGVAPKQLDQIEAAVQNVDQNYAAQCREISDELKAFDSTIKNLIEILQSKDFVTAFALQGSMAYLNMNAAAVAEGVQYVVLDPALWQFINSLLIAAGLAPLADGPLPFGDIIAILLLLVVLGVLLIAAVISLIQWIYTMAVDASEAKTEGEAKAETAPKSPKKVKNNKEANKVAEKLGYEGETPAEDLKEDCVPGNGSEFDMYRDASTGKIWLKHIQNGNWVETYLFYWPEEDDNNPFED